MKKIYLIGLLFCLLTSSCEDFLDKTPSTSLPAEEAITSITDLRNAVNGVAYLMSRSRMTYSADFAIVSDLKGSDFLPKSNNNQAGPIGRYTITKNDDIPYYAYAYFYRAIARVNNVLSVIDKVPHSEDNLAEYNAYKGELYAWRAMMHFDLARMFCNAPTAAADINAANSGIALSTAVYPPGYVAARTTLKQTYDQILSDFDIAMGLLSKDVKENRGRFNYWGALALRSRVHLYNGSYDKALADAIEVMGCKEYALYTRDQYTKVWDQAHTIESLFEMNITTTYNAQRNSVGYYCDSEGYGECAFVEGENTLLSYLTAHPEDIRSQMVKVQGGPNPGTYPAKYPGRDKQIYVNNPKIIRLSEVYLIAAEAALKTSSPQDAASYINALRRNRIENYVDVPSVTLDDILYERRLELFAENACAWDYWRNKKSVNNATVGEVNYDDYRAIFPIPQDEIDIAPDLLIQNPKY
ncbi:MAG: RagB/SusD family nutrient uptake outer membrane protein [Bacteroidales bacterium]